MTSLKKCQHCEKDVFFKNYKIHLKKCPAKKSRGATQKLDNTSTHLLCAIYSRLSDAIREAVNQGADLNTLPNTDHTPLMLAIALDNIDAAKLLISRGADINRKNKEGLTALMLAVIKGHTEIVKTLVIKGADINARFYGTTLLIAAAMNGHCNVVKYLLEEGVDVNAEDEEGDTALSAAISERQLDVAQLLRKAGAEGERTSVRTITGGLPSLGKRG